MKLWLDDIRPAPAGYKWVHSVNGAKQSIVACEKRGEPVELLDLDHDLGDYAHRGGDAIKLIYWLIERNTLYKIRLHTMNPVGRQNMQSMIERYWT